MVSASVIVIAEITSGITLPLVIWSNPNSLWGRKRNTKDTIEQDAQNIKDDSSFASIYFFRNVNSLAQAIMLGSRQRELNPNIEVIFALTRAKGYILQNSEWTQLDAVEGVSALSYDVNNPELDES